MWQGLKPGLFAAICGTTTRPGPAQRAPRRPGTPVPRRPGVPSCPGAKPGLSELFCSLPGLLTTCFCSMFHALSFRIFSGEGWDRTRPLRRLRAGLIDAMLRTPECARTARSSRLWLHVLTDLGDGCRALRRIRSGIWQHLESGPGSSRHGGGRKRQLRALPGRPLD
jgi:hypothetical protein